MMKLVRGKNVVLGLTDENVSSILEGRVLLICGDDMGAPGICVYIIGGNSHDEMERDLRAAGYDFPEGGADRSEHA